ncbi:MAG: PVC-type heme-binding CxxCH protein, partial [Chthoniobacteraceae bacterium]
MNRLLVSCIIFIFVAVSHAAPLRVFIRAGEKNRGQEVHAHPRFLAEWKTLLAERGMIVDGATDWPTTEQAAKADVIVAYAQDGGNATPEQEKVIEAFVKRGGGLVVIHTAAVSFTNPGWWRDMIGGAWVPKQTKWKEGPMDLYYTENQYVAGGHPITKGAANFHLDDEIYYDMDVKPEARVLAASYTPNVKDGKKQAEGGKAHIYDIQPQMWAYEKDGYRAFVSIPGHLFKTFALPQYRAVLLRGIAWAGKRTNLDEYVKREELDALTYPPGGPQKPADTLANLEVHPDFTMKLVAAEPLIAKPMNFDWDPAGRLWVAETPEYPNGRRGMRPDYRGKEWKDHGGIDPTPGVQERKAQDKISVLTDTDGDGVMDKKHVFADGLDLVTGFVFHKDGVIATQAPDILFIRDTDGDGKADKVEKLYTGLGIKDTHAVINNPRWGWDGWIYATHGYSASSEVKNVKGETQGTIGSGVVRFRPDGSKIEQYSSKGGNTWGLTITGDNRVMWTQPTSGQLLMQTVLPEYALARGKIGNTTSYKVVEPSPKSFPLLHPEQLAYVQIDWVGSFTAAAGCAIYDGGTWPAEYHGDYFTTEPTINVIHHTRLTPEGSSYTAAKLPGREETEFVRSKDLWWRPIEVRIGPDGAMYVADFYNQAVIHNDTRGPDHNEVNAAVRPDRDHYFGRIWRIDHKAAKKIAVPDLGKAGVGELAKALESPNRAVRMTACRLLRAKDGDPTPLPVKELLKHPAPETRIAALWVFGPFELEFDTVVSLLRDKDPSVRRNAALIEEVHIPGLASIAARAQPDLLELVTDPNREVRIAALRAFACLNLVHQGAIEQLVAAWPKLDDDFQRSAAVGAASSNPAAVIAAALNSGDGSLAALVTQLTQGVGERGETDAAAKLVIALGSKQSGADDLKRTILDTLGKSLKTAPEMTPELSAALGKLLDSSVSGSALPLAAQWDKSGALKAKVTELSTKLRTQLADAKADDAARLAAAQSLIGIRITNAEILPAVMMQIGMSGSALFQRQLILALGET